MGRQIAGFIGRTLGLVIVWVVVGTVVISIADTIVEEETAKYTGWIGGTLAVTYVWSFWRRKSHELALERREAETAAGSALRRVDPARYRAVLDDATEPLAFRDPDSYVGRVLLVAGTVTLTSPQAALVPR